VRQTDSDIAGAPCLSASAEDTDTEKLLTFFQRGRNQGSFDQGSRWGFGGLSRDLSSSSAVKSIQPDSPGAPYKISDPELASRLSFFLWSTIPDDRLFELASQGNLQDPATLEQQVRGCWLTAVRCPGEQFRRAVAATA